VLLELQKSEQSGASFVNVAQLVKFAKPVSIFSRLARAFLLKFVCTDIYKLLRDSRVTRHWMSTSNHLHGQPAETRPALVICAQEAFQATQGHKLYSKVLTIEPNRLLSKCSPSSRYWTLTSHCSAPAECSTH
jgi:hypothetical protein